MEIAARVLAQETGGRVVTDEAEEVGFLLVEGGILPVGGGSMRCLTFGTRSTTEPLTPDDIVDHPTVIDWDRNDAITRGLDLSDLSIETCLRHRFTGSGEVLVRADHGPLIVVDEGERWTSVHASFRLSDSNFWRLPAFPQFIRRCFARSVPRPGGAEAQLRESAE